MYRALIGVGAACGIAGMVIGAISEKRSITAPYPVGERSNRLDWFSAGSSVVVKPIHILQQGTTSPPVFESLSATVPQSETAPEPVTAPAQVSTVVESSETSDEPMTVEQPWRRPLEPQPSWVDPGPVCHKDWFKLRGMMHWRCRYW
jgi:hypothetical protein